MRPDVLSKALTVCPEEKRKCQPKSGLKHSKTDLLHSEGPRVYKGDPPRSQNGDLSRLLGRAVGFNSELRIVLKLGVPPEKINERL